MTLPARSRISPPWSAATGRYGAGSQAVFLLDEPTANLAPAIARDRSEGKGYARARTIVSETRKKLLADEKGIEQALLEASRA